MDKEIWKDILGYEGKYRVSNLGRVKSLNYKRNCKEKILKPFMSGRDYKSNSGYLQVPLMNNGIRKQPKVHRLVAEAFIPNPHHYSCINHKDEDKTNNCVDNLEWCDYKYNINYGTLQNRKARSLNKPILQYDKNGNFMKEYTSLTQASIELNIPLNCISSCCNGTNMTSYGYIFKFKKDLLQILEDKEVE